MSLSKKSKLAIGILLFGIATAFLAYTYVMKPPKEIEERDAALKATAIEILDKVKAAPNEWQDKAVVLSGRISSTDDSGATLEGSIYCQFKRPSDIPDVDTDVILKGRIIGYDDLLEELKLDQCVIEN